MSTSPSTTEVDQSLLYPSPYKEFWQAFSQNKGAVAGLIFMTLIAPVAGFLPARARFVILGYLRT